jgi:hypothetical protein
MLDKEGIFILSNLKYLKNGLNKPKLHYVHLSQQIEFQDFLQPFVSETLPFHFQLKKLQTAG